MSKNTKLHPSVQQFKQFVKKHPLLIKEVREGKKTWQDFYEEWTILGEKDEVWEKYQQTNLDDADDTENKDENENSSAQSGDLLSLLKNINLNDIQGHIQNLSGMMASVQSLLQSFQSSSSNNQSQEGSQNQQGQQDSQPQQNPFNFRKF